MKTVEAKEEPSAEDENKVRSCISSFSLGAPARLPLRQSADQSSPVQTFRTRLVSLWLLTNGALVVAIADANGLGTTSAEQSKKTSVYFSIILWSTAGLSAVRFIGSIYFW